jgi:hypothetical protein
VPFALGMDLDCPPYSCRSRSDAAEMRSLSGIRLDCHLHRLTRSKLGGWPSGPTIGSHRASEMGRCDDDCKLYGPEKRPSPFPLLGELW